VERGRLPTSVALGEGFGHTGKMEMGGEVKGREGNWRYVKTFGPSQLPQFSLVS